MSISDQKKSAKASLPTSRTRALFREVARDIIARDRESRRLGLTQNTIGEIERAMAKAYKHGQEALLDDRMALHRAPDGPVDWLDIPPRARETLRSMTLFFSHRWSNALPGASAPKVGSPDEIEMFVENGRKRWTVVIGERRSDHSVADGSVAPLIRLGLLAPRPENDARHVLTAAGIAAAKDYWRRSDADDPTLPREGMR
jgi:hypothetical protein